MLILMRMKTIIGVKLSAANTAVFLGGGRAGRSDNASEMHWHSSIGTSFSGMALTEYTLNVINPHTH